MSSHKLQVFLAGRFGKFDDLKKALQIRIDKVPAVEVVDLNDNAPDSKPALSRCYKAIDGAEFFLLLLGDEYGDIVEGEKASYTHLEYKRAQRDESKIIFPFLIGKPHNPAFKPENYDDSSLRAWVAEIRSNQTVSYLDDTRNTEQLANDIYDHVIVRLVELIWNVDEGDTGDDYDETSGLPEDSPIKFEELADSPKLSIDKKPGQQPLKMLAANHATEAQAALDLRLPQVAIHHLRKASELVPLDIVIGYWLARLLVATGRRKQCEEALRIAVRCTHVATGGDYEHKLQAMACRIIAARASERLGETALALEYAKAAHDGMGHHWMAKLEYGRQLALSGNESTALGMASEAFWLRPDLIRQIQRDAAYRGLGKAFGEFRTALKKEVIDRTGRITGVESRIREFARKLDEDERVAYHVMDETFAHPFAEPAEEPHHEQTLHEQSHHEQRTVLRMIGGGRASARSSLQILQKCARKLSADAIGFAFEGVKGLTPETKEHILEEIRTANLEVKNHSDQLKITNQKAEQSSEITSAFISKGMWGGVSILGVALIMTAFINVIVVAVVTLVIIGLGGWYFWQTFQSLEAGKAKNLSSARETDRRLAIANARSAELDDTMSSFEAAESELQKNTKTLCELVDQFEITGLRKRTFAPAVPVDRGKKGAQDLVWSDIDKANELGIAFELELLPPQLRSAAWPSTPKSKYWLARRGKSGELEVLNRSAAYFQ